MSHNISRNQQQNAALMWIKFAKTEKLKSGVKTALTKLKSNCHLKSSGASASQARSRGSIHRRSNRYWLKRLARCAPRSGQWHDCCRTVREAVSVCARLDAGSARCLHGRLHDAHLRIGRTCRPFDTSHSAELCRCVNTLPEWPSAATALGAFSLFSLGALARKGMTIVAENPIEAVEVQLRFSRCSVRHEYAACKFGGRTSGFAQSANPPRKALALSPLRQCGGGVWSLAALPPPITVSSGCNAAMRRSATSAT